MNPVLKQMQEFGIIPVVVLNDTKDAEPLGLPEEYINSWISKLKNII